MRPHQQGRVHALYNLIKSRSSSSAEDLYVQHRHDVAKSVAFDEVDNNRSSLRIYTGTSSLVMYLFKMNRAIANRRYIILFSLLLFVAMQYSAAAHASVHVLHTPDELCSIYNAIEHSSADLIGGAVSVPVITAQSDAVIFSRPLLIPAYFILPPSRAPPRA